MVDYRQNDSYSAKNFSGDDGFSIIPNEEVEEKAFNPHSDRLVGEKELDETFSRWMADTSDLLEYLEYQLKGFEKRRGAWLIPDDEKPTEHALLNERGIYDIIRICRLNFSKITNSTNIDKKEVHFLAREFEHSVIYCLVEHYQEYGIKRPQDLDVIKALLFNPYFAMLNQSLDNGTRKFYGGLMRYNEQFENFDRDAQRGKGKGFSLFGLRK